MNVNEEDRFRMTANRVGVNLPAESLLAEELGGLVASALTTCEALGTLSCECLSRVARDAKVRVCVYTNGRFSL